MVFILDFLISSSIVLGCSNPCMSWCTKLSCDPHIDRRGQWYVKNCWILIYMSSMFQVLLWWILLYSINYTYNFCILLSCLYNVLESKDRILSFCHGLLMRRFMFVTSHDYFVFNHPLILCNNISSKWWYLISKSIFALFWKREFVVYILMSCYFKCTFWVLSRVYFFL